MSRGQSFHECCKTPYPRECAYCGSRENLTRDHVPPKAIFSQPRPNDLITVYSCQRCHGGTSKDDEYFRLALQVRERIEDHPDVIKGRPALMRSLENPKNFGMLKVLLNNVVLAELVTPSGILIKHQLAFRTDMKRISRVVARIVKGLFTHHARRRLPDDYDVLVFNEERVSEWPKDEASKMHETLIKPIQASHAIEVGKGIFSYKLGVSTQDPNVTGWILVFYGRAAFLGLTIPSASRT